MSVIVPGAVATLSKVMSLMVATSRAPTLIFVAGHAVLVLEAHCHRRGAGVDDRTAERSGSAGLLGDDEQVARCNRPEIGRDSLAGVVGLLGGLRREEAAGGQSGGRGRDAGHGDGTVESLHAGQPIAHDPRVAGRVTWCRTRRTRVVGSGRTPPAGRVCRPEGLPRHTRGGFGCTIATFCQAPSRFPGGGCPWSLWPLTCTNADRRGAAVGGGVLS